MERDYKLTSEIIHVKWLSSTKLLIITVILNTEQNSYRKKKWLCNSPVSCKKPETMLFAM